MVESPAEKNKSRSFHDVESLRLTNEERIEQSLRQLEREIKKGEEMRNKSNWVKKGQKV